MKSGRIAMQLRRKLAKSDSWLQPVNKGVCPHSATSGSPFVTGTLETHAKVGNVKLVRGRRNDEFVRVMKSFNGRYKALIVDGSGSDYLVLRCFRRDTAGSEE